LTWQNRCDKILYWKWTDEGEKIRKNEITAKGKKVRWYLYRFISKAHKTHSLQVFCGVIKASNPPLQVAATLCEALS
jgi:hypothetical protein